MKKLWNKGWGFLLKHNITVCACLILTCIYFSLTIVNNVDHAKKELDLLKDNLTLQVELKEQAMVLLQQGEVLDFQGEVIAKQGQTMGQIEETMEVQRRALENLIQYMKDIGEWPPKLKPIDPDKWIYDELKEGGRAL